MVEVVNFLIGAYVDSNSLVIGDRTKPNCFCQQDHGRNKQLYHSLLTFEVDWIHVLFAAFEF